MPLSLPPRIDQADLSGQRVLVRTDLGEHIDSNGNTAQIRIPHLSLPTIQLLQERGAAVLVLASTPALPGAKAPSFAGAAEKLGEHLGSAVALRALPDKGHAFEIAPGTVHVLENLSRHKGEAAGDATLTARIADLGNIFVNDAPCASAGGGMSVDILPKKLPSFAGFGLYRELEVVSELMSRKYNPLVAILGGTDVAGSLAIARRLMSGHNLKQLFIGGGIAYTFLRSRLVPIGRSISDASLQVDAFQIIERSELSAVDLFLPVDHVVADRFGRDAKTKTVGRMDIPDAWTALDAGPKTVSAIEKAVKNAGAVFWHAPLGAVEMERFGKGTLALAKALSRSRAVSVVAGDALNAFLSANGYAERFSLLAASSRLTLELLAGRVPTGISALRGA